tara:strand:- start:388 stop:528 length:141 start_codon:yes stop_codon:yes gene_type:complete
MLPHHFIIFVSDLQKYKIGEIKAEKPTRYSSAILIKPLQILQLFLF